MFFIFFNNAIKGFLNILLGPILGLYPLAFIVLNGFILGLAFSAASSSGDLFLALISILPHGVFEVPAIIICNAMGFRLAYTAFKSIFGRGSVLRVMKRDLKIFILIVLPILFIAAIIEVYITPKLAGITI